MIGEAAQASADSSLFTSIGVLIAALSAVILGAWNAWQKFKKGLTAELSKKGDSQQVEIVSAAITETATMQALTRATNQLCDAIDRLEHTNRELTERTKDSRSSTRSNTEEMNRLRMKLADVYELAREMKR